MDFGPIFSTLSRHRTAATLIVLEIALSCAIVSNAVFLIGERLSRMQRPSGIAESELVRVSVTGRGKEANAQAVIQEDVQTLASVPGVRKVAPTRQLPFGNNSWNSEVKLSLDQIHTNLNATIYLGSKDFLETLGVRLIAGRDFLPDEYIDEEEARETKATTPIILTRAVSERLWPGQIGIGQNLYLHGRARRVVGIVERLARPNERGSENELSLVVPIHQRSLPVHQYVLRVDPERRTEVLAAAVGVLGQSGGGRLVLDQDTVEEMRNKYYSGDRAMAWLLVGVCAALLVVTALGIVGLASFWVQQRTRQIGIRRALGATRAQILRYFQAENLLLATFGIALGMGLAYGINQLLMERYELGRLPAQFLPVGAVSLWLIGQLAVLGPALRAASVPPAVATRTV